MKKKFLAGLLSLVMILSLLPITALADGKACKIGGTEYETIAQAITAAGTEAKTIELLQDVTENVTIPANANITLDLKGKNITATATDKIVITNNGALTIKDSTATGTTIPDKDGNVTYSSGAIQGGKYGIDNKGALTIEGGTIKNNNANSSEAVRGAGVTCSADNCSVNMTGGLIQNNIATGMGGGIGVYNCKGVTINISGGAITKNTAPSGGGIAFNNGEDGKINVLNISENAYICNNTSTSSGGGLYSYGRYTQINVKGGTISKNSTVNYGGGIRGENGANIEISGGLIDSNESTSYPGGGVYCDGKLSITGGTISNSKFNDEYNGSEVYMNFNSSALNNEFSMSDGVIKNDSNKSTLIYVKGGKDASNPLKLTISGDADVQGSILVGYSEFLSDDSAISGGRFKGKITAKVSVDGNTPKKFLAGGVYSEKSKENTSTDLIKDGKIFIPNEDATTKATYPWTIGVPKVAKIVRTGVEYETLQAAVNEAKDGDTVVVLKDIVVSTALKVGKKDITIDGDGHTFTQAEELVEGPYHFFNFGRQEGGEGSTYTFKNAVIDGLTKSTYLFRVEDCTMTLDNVEFKNCEGTYITLFTHANANVKNCKYINNSATGRIIDFNSNAAEDGYDNVLTITNCLFKDNRANGTAIVGIAEDKSVNVSNSTFDSNILNSSDNGAPLYLGDQNSTCTGCLFIDNTVNYSTTEGKGNRVRAAGAIFTWAAGDEPGTITNNAFVNNKVIKQNDNKLTCYAKSVYSGGYYSDDDLKANYWGGKKPVISAADITSANNDIYAEYNETKVFASNYADKYEKNKDNYGVTVHIAPVTVTFDSDGGTKVAEKKAEYNSTVEKPSNPTKDGNTFAGWVYKYGENAGNQFFFDTKLTEDTELIANWFSDDAYGKITVKDTGEGIKAQTSIKKSDIPLTVEESALIEAGSKLDIDLLVKVEEAKVVKEKEKELIKESMKKDQKLGMYLDCSMFKTLDGEPIGQITETLNPITIVLTVPENLRADGRVYSIIRVHNDEAETLFKGKADKDWNISFETDKFSTYAIAYEGGTDINPKTGDSNNIGLFVGLGDVALLAIIALAVIMLKKKTYR